MEESKKQKFSNWMQDNLQAIIIIAIALFVLFFLIYSYSKKSNNEEATVNDKDQQEEVISEIPADTDKNDSSSESVDSNSNNTESSTTNSNDNQTTKTTSPNDYPENIDRGKGPYNTTQTETTKSQQYKKDGVITVTASYGESLTHLARKATAQYISENNVQGLTPAHKIYIEDTLRRSVSNKSVTPGTSVSFSNESISSAINSAKSLNDYQLQHLNGYARYVSGL